MPNFKNNQGFGALPVIAILAIAISGSIVGYNYYQTNNQSVSNSTISEETEQNVLQANTNKNFNPGNLPFYWIYADDRKPGIWNIRIYITGRDITKLNAAIAKIRRSNYIMMRPSKDNKPCYPGGKTSTWDSRKIRIKKLSNDFYLLSVDNVPTYWQSDIDKRCGVAFQQPYFYFGLSGEEYFVAPENTFPLPASVMFSSPVTPGRSINAPARRNVPTVDLTGLQRIEEIK